MKNRLLNFYGIYSIALFAIIFLAVGSVAAQVRPYRVTDRQVQTLVTRIETGTDAFRRQINTALSRRNNNESEEILDFITEFETSADSFRQDFDARRSQSNDVSELLNSATRIDQYMKANRSTVAAQNQWRTLQNDLSTLAGYYRVSWNWNNYPTNPNTGNNPNYPSNGTVPYRVPNSTISTLLSRLETRTDSYRRAVELSIDRGYLNNTRSEETFKTYVTDFENATDALKRSFDSRRSTSNEVQEVLYRAASVDSFMRDYRFTATSESQWNLIRTDLNTLSGYYNVSWNWDSPTYPTNNNANYGLTGTYRLNTSQSDDVSAIVNSTLGNTTTTGQVRGNGRRGLERRLSSPEMIAIDKRNREVTIASSLSPQVTFQADGVARTETTANGRSIRVTASESYNGVSINTEGDRINDFFVSFTPLNNGQMRVVRRVYLENRNETVTVSSVYDKTNNSAQWSMIDSGNGNVGGNKNGNTNDFYIPNGTRLTATLQNAVNTRDSQNGDRITLEVTSPSQYDGAIIEGRVANTEKSGRVSGRATVSMEFDTIRLANGQTYKFAGFIDSVKAANGDNVTVNNEGTVRDSNQTTKTVTRAGIGAALGAIIGAIAGGGQGAAIGAAVGAGAGAGTVVLQGRDNIELGQGSEFNITASAPANVGSR